MKYLSLIISLLFLVQTAPAKSCHSFEQSNLETRAEKNDHCHSENKGTSNSEKSSSDNCAECLSFCCQFTVFKNPETNMVENSNYKPTKVGWFTFIHHPKNFNQKAFRPPIFFS